MRGLREMTAGSCRRGDGRRVRLRSGWSRGGFTMFEKILAMVCVSIAITSTFALFLLNSGEMRFAHREFGWRLEVEAVADRIAQELRRAGHLVAPLVGTSSEARYLPGLPNSDTLEISERARGFALVDRQLMFLQANAEGRLMPHSEPGRPNPWLTDLEAVDFIRESTRRLRLRIRAAVPAERGVAPSTVVFERVICLRNP